MLGKIVKRSKELSSSLGVAPPVAPLAVKEKKTQAQMRKDRAQMRLMENALDLHEISAVQFSFYSTQEIDNMAELTVSNSNPNGLNSVRDPRFGPIDDSSSCQTCGRDIAHCRGHYGKIIIPKLMNPHCVPHIIHILSIVCNTCGKLLFTRKELESREKILSLPAAKRIQKMHEIIDSLQTKICPNAQATDKSGKKRPPGESCSINPTYISYTDNKHTYTLSYTYPGGTEKSFAPRKPTDIWNILNIISDEDCRLMGFQPFTHPRNMIIERIIVIPYNARPDTYQGGGTAPDSLTIAYQDVVKYASDYFNSKDERKRIDAISNLYNKILTMFVNSDGHGTNGNNIISSFKDRVQGKTAIVRFSIMGKRVNYGGRTVIAPGHNIKANEVGIPIHMTPKLTRPILVTKENLKELQEKYNNKMITAIKHISGPKAGIKTPVDDRHEKYYPKYTLTPGDEVSRWLQDGDYIIANRQPSLSKFSMLKFNAKILNERVARLPLACTKAFNADFDGDEMNFHVCQTIEAYAEADHIIGIEHNIIGHDNRPIIGPVYDSLTGIYLLTLPATIHKDFSIDFYRAIESEIENLEKEISKEEANYKNSISEQKSLLQKLAHLSISPSLKVKMEALLLELKTINDTIPNRDLITEAYYRRRKDPKAYQELIQGLDGNASKEALSIMREFNIENPFGLEERIVNSIVKKGFLEYQKQEIIKNLSILENEISKLAEATRNLHKLLKSKKEDLRLYSKGIILDKIVFDRAIAMNASLPQMKTLRARLEKHSVPWGSAAALASSCFPENFQYEKEDEDEDGEINHVKIEDGILLSGYLEKNNIGISDGSIIAEMVKSHGGKVTMEFISSIQFIIAEYLQNRGFTIGYFDCAIIDKEFLKAVKSEIVRTEVSLSGLMIKPRDATMAQKQEREINQVLESYTNTIKKLAKDYLTRNKENAMLVMTKSGAKGSMTNITQISVSVGQQRIEGKRPQPSLPGYRCLPIFKPGDTDPRARGFVYNSYNSGLDPGEFYFHLQGSREGVIDTSVNTAKTGDLQHKLIKAQEDIAIAPDGSVRSTDGAIVQFVYLNGFDPTRLMGVHISGSKVPFPCNLNILAMRANKKLNKVQ